jgi:CRISPR/Cas system CSM-associated protein Csm5 (group 7 of RAMP superfamily)
MKKLNKKYDLLMEVLTPLHVGAGAEKDWVQGCDFVVDNNHVKILNLKKVSQFVDNSDLSNALMNKDDAFLKSKLADNLNKCVENEFCVNFFGKNDIKTFIKNGLTNNPIVPGSSVKGAIRSIMVDYLLDEHSKKSKKLNEDVLFGKASVGESLFRFIKVADAEFEKTDLVNTKIFNLKSSTTGGWKHDRNRTTDKFKTEGFNSFYEVIGRSQKSTLSLSFADVAFQNYAYKIKSFSELKTKLIDTDISFLFGLINKHTKNYLEKEKVFFVKYATDKTELIVRNIDFLLNEIPTDGKYCILKIAAGSGFHSITGDWQFDDYSIDELSYKEEKWGKVKTVSRGMQQGNKSAKSRKIAISGENDFSLMGFIKLTVLDDKMLAAIELEKENQKQIEIEKQREQQQEQRLLKQQKLELEAKKKEFENLISQAQTYYQNNENKAALSLIEQAEDLGLDIVSHHELKQDILKAIEIQAKQEEIEAIKKQEEEKRKAETEAKLAVGLAAYLEEKNLKNDFKVQKFGMLKAKVEKYLKDSDNKKLPESEWESLMQSINRIFVDLKPRDQRVWLKFEKNKIWQEIANWTEPDFAKSIFDKLI